MARSHFVHTVHVLQSYLTLGMTSPSPHAPVAPIVMLLAELHHVNRTLHLVHEADFQNAAVCAALRVQEAAYELRAAPQRTFRLTQYPFLFDADCKRRLLVADARLQMTVRADGGGGQCMCTFACVLAHL